MIRSIHVLLIILFSQLWSILPGQQLVDEKATWVTGVKTLTLREYDEVWLNTRVAPHFIGDQPEANYAYRHYLNDLKSNGQDSLYQAALPEVEYIYKTTGNRKQATFFATEYLFDKRFEHYPILGLQIEQIQRYFIWKSRQLVDAYSEYSQLPDSAIMCIMTLGYRIPLQGAIFATLKPQYKYGFTKPESDWNEFHQWLADHEKYAHLRPSPASAYRVKHPYLKKHGITPVGLYGLAYNRERILRDGSITELCGGIGKIPMDTAKVYQIKLLGITMNRKRRIKLSYDKLALVPFRYVVSDFVNESEIQNKAKSTKTSPGSPAPAALSRSRYQLPKNR